MSAYFKTVLRSFKSNIGRFISISVIILLGIAFVSGLGTLSPQIKESVSDHVKSERADIIIKSTSAEGFTQLELDALSADRDEYVFQAITAIDIAVDDLNVRVYAMPLDNMAVNRIALSSGKLPASEAEVLIDRTCKDALDIGGKITVLGLERTVSGVAANPLIFAKDGEPDVTGEKTLDVIIYLNSAQLTAPLPITDVYVTDLSAADYGIFTSEYKNIVQQSVDILKSGDGFVYLTLEENRSCAILESYCDKVVVISLIFPVFFIAVSALVVLTTMTRLIEEERTMLGCYKTLGIGEGKIIFKYLFASAVCCLAASVLGGIVGLTLLPNVIYPAFAGLFFMPAMSKALHIVPGIIAAVIMAAAVLGVTFYVAKKELSGSPAAILRPKAPKPGKKVLLEKIPFIWNPLSFKYKSTFRNILRQTKHLAMTVISVAGSTALVLAGFALSDVANTGADDVAGFKELFMPISAVVIIFALLLCAFVVYNLTNMNISERKREIATLKVLGYHDTETAGYIYREIFIMALLGVIVGIPLGVGLIAFVFDYLDFGAISSIKWYSYIFAGGIVLLFVAVVDLLLNRKIRAIDMNTSLKSTE